MVERWGIATFFHLLRPDCTAFERCLHPPPSENGTFMDKAQLPSKELRIKILEQVLQEQTHSVYSKYQIPAVTKAKL